MPPMLPMLLPLALGAAAIEALQPDPGAAALLLASQQRTPSGAGERRLVPGDHRPACHGERGRRRGLGAAAGAEEPGSEGRPGVLPRDVRRDARLVLIVYKPNDIGRLLRRTAARRTSLG